MSIMIVIGVAFPLIAVCLAVCRRPPVTVRPGCEPPCPANAVRCLPFPGSPQCSDFTSLPPGLARDCHPGLRRGKFEVSPNLSSSASPVSQASTQVSLSRLRPPFRHARVAGHLRLVYHRAGSGTLHASYRDLRSRRILIFRLVFVSFWP